jgi:hypothetical protein
VGRAAVRVDGGGVDGWLRDGAAEVIGVGVWAGCVGVHVGVLVLGRAFVGVARVGVFHLLVTENVP